MKKYYVTPFDLYSLGKVKNRGTIVEGRTLLFSGKCSIWSSSKTYGQNSQAVQVNGNSYEINVSSEYSGIKIGDIFVINSVSYKVANVIAHQKPSGSIDNYQIFVTITENVSGI